MSRAGRQPHGRLRVSCVTAFALHQLAPKLPLFLESYPEIDLELSVTDRVMDLLEDNMDVGIRTGPIDDPSLITRKISDVERGLFASPGYLERFGTPNRREDLQHHNCIVLSFIPSSHRWLFHEEVRGFDIARSIVVDSAEAALDLAIAGGGITRVGEMLVGEALCLGQLNPVLSECHVSEHVPLSVAYPQGRHRMPKVRVFIDFLIEQFKKVPWRENK
ncbi:MAG: substrate binding domain-containing protein [Desulfobulbia bacterium]